MRERVFTRIGKFPVILVAPHGGDDSNTIELTKQVAEDLDIFAVINQGFRRSDSVDVDNDLANCNRIDHAQQPIVCEEFLKPILDYKRKLLKACGEAFIFHIHGAGNIVHKMANEWVSLIVGYGLAQKQESLSCDRDKADLFIHLYRKYCHAGEVYEGKDGIYSGRARNNLNQYFRKHELQRKIQSMQLEFPFSFREDLQKTRITAAYLTAALFDFMHAPQLSHTITHKYI